MQKQFKYLRIINGRISTSVLTFYAVTCNIQEQSSYLRWLMSSVSCLKCQDKTEQKEINTALNHKPANDIKTHHQSDYYVSWLVWWLCQEVGELQRFSGDLMLMTMENLMRMSLFEDVSMTQSSWDSWLETRTAQTLWAIISPNLNMMTGCPDLTCDAKCHESWNFW